MSSEISISVILARNISKTFKPLWKPPVQALKDVGFEVQSGEIVGLIGPNGAGKTTLLRILLGFLKADRGEVRIFGEVSESLRVRRKVGYQADYQFRSSGITVETYLKLHLALLGRDEENGQIDVLLKHFRLSDDRKRWLKDLSKGMRQKVELALAFLGSPELVFFDEPTASLDPPSVFELRDFLAERKGSGITVFFSSHNLTEVEKVCNRVLFIGQGQLRAEYSMEEVQPGFLEEAFRRHVVETIKS